MKGGRERTDGLLNRLLHRVSLNSKIIMIDDTRCSGSLHIHNIDNVQLIRSLDVYVARPSNPGDAHVGGHIGIRKLTNDHKDRGSVMNKPPSFTSRLKI
jgi:hypothetical protein